MYGKNRRFPSAPRPEGRGGGNPNRKPKGASAVEIVQFRYNADNLGYLVVNNGQALAVDPGAARAMADYVSGHGLTLAAVTNTHGHGDHTSGNADLARRTGAKQVDHRELGRAGSFDLGGGRIKIVKTPGHTADSIVFHTGDALITGDTLFNGTVGNPFSGDLKAFFDSIKALMAFPDDTRVFAGHDYIDDSLAFAKLVEPDNPDRKKYRRSIDPACIFTTLAQEKAVNPYLRFNEPALTAFMKNKGLSVATEYERWESVMQLE